MNVLKSHAITENFYTNLNIVRKYAFKSDLKIKWVHPGKISCVNPEKSGDLEGMSKLPKTQLQHEFVQCKELETANEYVKRLFSLEFAPRFKSSQVYIKNTVDSVRRYELDNGSIEARIGNWTGAIRAMQDELEIHPMNKRLKVKLKELIDKRKKHLKYLRRWDYKRFEWIIDTLNIVYKPPPSEFHWITRKGSLTKLTEKYCNDLKTDRLEEYKFKLEKEKPVFLEEKIRSLEFIRREQLDCGVEVTVSQVEIDEAKNKLVILMRAEEERNKLKNEE